MVYEAHIKKHNGERILLYYDEDKSKVIRAIQKYVKENAFTYYEKGKCYSCATFLLIEKSDRTTNAKVISEKMYHEIFDTIAGKLKGGKRYEDMS